MKKIILIVSLVFLLTSCFWNKEKEVKVVNNNANVDTIQTNTGVENIELTPVTKDVKEMSLTELSNSIYGKDGGNNIKEKIGLLSSSGASIEDKSKAIYLKSFVGDYTEALNDRKNLCKTDISLCKKVGVHLVSYRPTDLEGNILSDVSLSINGENKGTLKATNDLNLYTNFVNRVKLSKKGYLDYYSKFSISDNGLKSESISPKMLKATSSETIFSGTGLTKKTNNYEFEIEANTFSYMDGTPVVGNIDIYFYDINGSEGDLNVLNLDSFNSDSLSYLGGSMVTHGMPLVKAYKGDKELKIVKPIIGKGKIINLSKMPGIDLYNVPKGEYLSSEELEKYNIPSFWNLNQESGVWMTSKMKILDNDGSIEFELK